MWSEEPVSVYYEPATALSALSKVDLISRKDSVISRWLRRSDVSLIDILNAFGKESDLLESKDAVTGFFAPHGSEVAPI